LVNVALATGVVTDQPFDIGHSNHGVMAGYLAMKTL
jgi:hypothetical protein